LNPTPFERFCEGVALQLGGAEPKAGELQAIGSALRQLCAEIAPESIAGLMAEPGQERLHPIALAQSGGPSLYVVSDGTGVVSAPHEHQTWVAIVGLRGVEVNTIFRRADASTREIVREREVAVGPGDLLVLDAAQIHSTRVDDESSTVHVHLYGRALSALPPFAQRCFDPRAGTPLNGG
jgi:predicted metal-dependent enzyme (double-stranded beta helix superfamily)